MAKSTSGFASMSPERRREAARKGAASLHAKGKAHKFNHASGKAAGRLGGHKKKSHRAVQMKFLLDEDERAALQSLADAAGLSVSDWLRQMIRLRAAGVVFNADGSVDVPLDGDFALPALSVLLARRGPGERR